MMDEINQKEIKRLIRQVEKFGKMIDASEVVEGK